MGRNHCGLGWRFGNCYPCISCCPCINETTGAKSLLRGIEVQLQGEATTVASRSSVVFDTLIANQAQFIAYNAITGTVTITQSGLYHINWWVATDGIAGGRDVFIAFSIITSAGDNIKASSPNGTDQISGNALIAITASPINPVTLQLVNATDGTIAYASIPIKASFSIYR